MLCSGTNGKLKSVGNHGERIAASYLKKCGYRIVATNVRYGRDELDILSLTPAGSTLAIIEVRSTATPNGNPESTLTRRKRRAMYRVAKQVYPEALKHNCTLRIDLVTVRITGKMPKVRHYKHILPFKQRKTSDY